MKQTSVGIKITVVIPVYNSQATLEELFSRLHITLTDLVGNNHYEIVFVNDGSRDNSWTVLTDLAKKNKNTTIINLTRNFGQHNAIMCGFAHARGEMVVTIDDDLQILPEEIGKLILAMKPGIDVVYGIFGDKKHTKVRNIGSEIVQWIYRKTFKMNIKITSFRLIRKEIIDLMLSYEKSFTYIDGLLCWYSNQMVTANVRHYERKEGKSGYSLSKLVMLALNMLTNFSITPLQIASLMGFLFAVTGFGLGTFILIKKILFDIPVSGFSSTIVSITIFSGVQLITIGMLGEYIGRIHINVSKRPQYAIRNIIHANDKSH